MSTSTRRARRTLAVVGVVLAVAGLGWFTFEQISEPSPPSAFYRPPAKLPAGGPGTLVRDEPLARTVAGQRRWRVLYTSTRPDGSATAVSGVVVAPAAPAPPGGWPVVAWAHGTRGVVPRCAGSLEADGALDRVPELDALLAAGTVVTVTDYPGLGTPGIHPYLVGESEGRAVLDSVRAARSLLDGQTSDTAAVYGHSQGGHAALYAGELAAGYAPELDVVGVAAMAPPTDLADLLVRDEHEAAGIVLTSLAVTSWAEWYPDADPATIVHPVARPLVERVGRRCMATTEQGLGDVPDVALLERRFLSTDPGQAPGWGDRLRENSPTTAPPTIPLLVSQGLSDTLVRPDVTEAFVRSACAAGAPVELDTYPSVGHFEVRTVAAPKVRMWLLARLQGLPAGPPCRTEQQP